MRTFMTAAATVAIVSLSLPAYAQFNLGGDAPRDKTRYTEEEKRNEAAAEKAYRETIKNTKGASNERHDPWFNVRPPTPAKGQK